MSSTSEPAHLSNHHRNTLRQLFQHPVSHNIDWRAVVSLLEAVGSIVEQHAGKFEVTLGSETEFFDPPAGKDIDVQTVVDLRGMLSRAGYGADAEEGGARGPDRARPHAGRETGSRAPDRPRRRPASPRSTRLPRTKKSDSLNQVEP